MGKGKGSKRRRRAPRRRRLAVAIGVVLLHAMVAPAATAAAGATPARASGNPWQSWSYDGFWGVDRTLADPGALYADGEAVVYATTGLYCIWTDCATYWVPRFTSTSMAATAGLQSDAMPALPAWVDPADRAIWAPSVVEVGGLYVMYFGATAAPGTTNAGLKCVGAAASPTAEGPFLPATTALACASPGYWALDPYVVADGTSLYLLWREDDAAHVRGKIVAAPLSADGVSLAGTTRTTLMVGEYAWEDGSLTAATAAATDSPFDRRQPPSAGADVTADADDGIGPVENPAMARHPATGEWLLTWSANSWNTQAYATGLATCASPLGPCERVSHEQPWLRTSSDSSITTTASFGGAGGLSFALGPDTFLYAVFHAYRGTGDNSNSTRIGWAYQVVHTAEGYRFAEFGEA